jgi:hypothetical protein
MEWARNAKCNLIAPLFLPLLMALQFDIDVLRLNGFDLIRITLADNICSPYIRLGAAETQLMIASPMVHGSVSNECEDNKFAK